MLGFLSVLSIFALVTLSSYSVVPQPELADTRQPSMIGVFQSVVGDWGSVFISVAVVVSVLGAYLAWTLMAAEVIYIPARNEDLPEFLGQENGNGAPITALVVTSLAYPGAARRHLGPHRRVELHAGPVHEPGPDPLLPRGCLRPEAGADRRKLTSRCSPGTRRKETIFAGVATAYTLFLFDAAGSQVPAARDSCCWPRRLCSMSRPAASGVVASSARPRSRCCAVIVAGGSLRRGLAMATGQITV